MQIYIYIYIWYIWYIYDIYWEYLGHILGLSCAYLVYILGISWGYLGNTLGISLVYLGHILCISWEYLRDLPEPSFSWSLRKKRYKSSQHFSSWFTKSYNKECKLKLEYAENSYVYQKYKGRWKPLFNVRASAEFLQMHLSLYSV